MKELYIAITLITLLILSLIITIMVLLFKLAQKERMLKEQREALVKKQDAINSKTKVEKCPFFTRCKAELQGK